MVVSILYVTCPADDAKSFTTFAVKLSKTHGPEKGNRVTIAGGRIEEYHISVHPTAAVTSPSIPTAFFNFSYTHIKVACSRGGSLCQEIDDDRVLGLTPNWRSPRRRKLARLGRGRATSMRVAGQTGHF